MVSGPINCVKYLVFIFNLIFFLFGITLVAVGAYVQTQLSAYLDFLSTNINGPAILLIIVGLIIFLVSFFGCCGAVKENYCMVLTFSILMMVLLVCQIGGAIAGFVYSNDIKQLVTTQMKKSMVNYDDPEKGGVTKTWDTVQTKWHCCGTDNPDDWTTAQPDKFDKAYPKSCCDDQIETCDSSSSTLNKQGCVSSVEDIFEKNVYYIGAVGIALAVIQVIGVVVSCYLAGGLRNKKHRLL